MDYVKSKGIKTRTGVEEEDFGIFVLKELIDNAIDFIEDHVSAFLRKDETPIIKVIIDQINSITKIRVINSNAEIDVFSKDLVRQIFKFTKFYSSKRNRYQISRGALGDALKEVLCVPYALADKKEIENWNHGLEITTDNKNFNIRIGIDKIRQKIKPDIKIKKVNNNNNQKFTEISISLPEILDYSLVDQYLFQYSILNPHMEFYFQLPKTINNHNNTFTENNNHLKSVQQLKGYSNRQSIYYYSLTEFKNLIFSIEDDNLPIYYLVKDFREATNIKKDQLLTSIGHLKHHTDEIVRLYQQIRNTLPPKSKLELPFELSKISRQDAFKKRLEQHGFKIDKINYQLFDGYNKSENKNIEYPFYVEIMIAHVINLSNNIYQIEGVNSAIHWYPIFHGDHYNTFQWIGKNKKANSAYSVLEIFEKHGYSRNDEKHKKPNSIAIINLISSRIDYKNYGKSEIDLKPFADSIASNISKICKTDNKNDFDKKPTANTLLRKLLKERLSELNKNPELKYKDRWTQSTVFYHLRPILIKHGIEVTRKYITSSIKKICEELGKSREELGIFAADRAQLYFNHMSHDVGLDELSNLMKMGTDLIIIEKEGAVEVLAPFADKYGIALLNSRGFLTEYASRLSSLSKKYGSNVVILTDFDVSGLLLATKMDDNIHRIGIDFKTIQYFGLGIHSVQESYVPSHNHLLSIQKMAYNKPTLKRSLDYLSHKRIEIDSVLANVGSERFWNFIVDELGNLFPYRNYNRAIEIPEYFLPKEIESVFENIKVKIRKITFDERNKIEKELENTHGFIDDINIKNRDIEMQIRKVISNDKSIENLISEITKLRI